MYTNSAQARYHKFNTYLYCCKSLPRTVTQILHLPSLLRSKNSLYGLREGGWGGGGWIATPLPATHVHKLRPGMMSQVSQHTQLVTLHRVCTKQGLRCQKNQEAFSECSREPAISRRSKRFVPTTSQASYLPNSDREVAF